MKKYVRLYAVLVLMLLAGFLFFVITPRMIRPREADLVALNEIAKQSALHWREPESLRLEGLAYPFTLVDNDGRVLYMSEEGLPESIPEAIRRGFVPVDVIVGAGIAGKALVEASPEDPARAAGDRLAIASLMAFVLLCALSAAFLSALHSALVKPFARMQAFAHKITTGMFDEPLPMDKSNVFGLFTQSFDVMRVSLYEARQNQLEAERAKKELIASLSHDVKTPVTSIRLIAELLQAGNADPATAEKLKTIEMKADQIDQLMNNMLHSALEELGELKVEPTVEESGVLRGLFENAGDLARIRVGDVPDCLIELDVMRMEQVVGNIIANSHKYAGTDVDVDFQIRGELLQVDVNDYGEGVGAQDIDLIATKFYRGENAKASQSKGEGLGLYIAKQLMDKMGNGLEVFNREDGFTVRLWIRLPK